MIAAFLTHLASAIVGYFGGYTAMPWWAYEIVNHIYDFLGLPHSL